MLLEQVDIQMQKIWTFTTTSPSSETDLKWITDLNIKPKTEKLLKENEGENICDCGLDKNNFRYGTQSTSHRKTR